MFRDAVFWIVLACGLGLLFFLGNPAGLLEAVVGPPGRRFLVEGFFWIAIASIIAFWVTLKERR